MSSKSTQPPAAARPAPTAPAWRRGGQLAGALVVLIGLAGLWLGGLSQARQATATTATPPQPTAPATASKSGIIVQDAYVKQNGPGEALAYFTVVNRAAAPDVLTTITSDDIAHDTTLYLSGGEATTGTLTIGPGSTDRLAPGGQHVRLALHGALVPGRSVTLTLRFSRAGDIAVLAAVR